MDHFLVLHMITVKNYHVQSVQNDVLRTLATRVAELCETKVLLQALYLPKLCVWHF